jgi:hypothetical protein
MLHQSKLTGFFRVALIVVFSGVMILGTGNSNSAQAEKLDNVLDGLVKGKMLCDGDTKKSKVKKPVWIQLLGEYPPTAALVTIQDAYTFELAGTSAFKGRGKVKKNGFFLFSGQDDLGSDLTLNAKFKLKKDGTIFKVQGKFELLNPDKTCLTKGKFKAMDKPTGEI